MKPNEYKKDVESTIPLLSAGSTRKIIGDKEAIKSQEAASHIIRHQINKILDKNDQEHLELTSTYARTHTEHVTPQTEQLKQYHSAWQNYYQKYYEGYYGQQLKQSLAEKNNKELDPKTIQKNKVQELKQQLLTKVQEKASETRKSRHFIPIIAGLVVVFIFLALQYNRLVISNIIAYVSPGSINPQNIIIDPNSADTVSADPKLIIPKINVEVPVVYDIGNDNDSQMKAMTTGVAHFAIPGANSHPGENGNTVIAGHSSNDLFDSGEYKFIFAQLEKLDVGDMIYANYNSKRYTYSITKKEVVNPNELDKLVTSGDKPILTLVTCTPLGTSKYRLLVTAEQISPDPALATAKKTEESHDERSSIPGNSPTFLERLFGSQ